MPIGDTPPSRPDGNTPGSPRRVALLNQKGGVGKTTTTVNLAAALVRGGKSVLVVDLDPQAHATLHLGVSGEPGADAGPTLYDLLLDDGLDPAGAVRDAGTGLRVLPSVTSMAGAEQELAGRPDRHARLGAILPRVEGGADVVLIDCPPSLGVLTINALACADEVVIPMQAQFFALQGVGKLLETVRTVAGSVNPRLRVRGVVLCMHDAGTTLSREVVADVEAFFEAQRGFDTPWRFARVLRPPIRRNIKLAEAPGFGRAIFDYAPGATGAEDYMALAQGLAAEWAGRPAQSGTPGPSEPPEVVVTPSASAEPAS